MSDSFEKLLARTEHRDATPAGSCPDAGVLAAYLDATLTPSEHARVEAHAADCARCALQLATLVRLEDVSGSPQHAPARPWWPRLAWMVPAATAVVVAAIYVALPSRGIPQAPPPPQGAAIQERVELKERKSASEPAATAEASSGNALAQKAPITARELQRKAEGQAAGPAPADPDVRERPLAETDAAAGLGAAKATRPPGPLVIFSPDGRVQWRVDGGRIERSTDGGQTWSPERAPVPKAIIIGAAPSVDVCWLAGSSGQILRRTDAGTWVDVSPVPRLAIVRFDVSTSLEAVAIRADGTTMKTADGGRTWVR